MRKLLFIISLLISTLVHSQISGDYFWPLLFRSATSPHPPPPNNQPFSFSEIPYSAVDIQNPGRGAEQWHNGSQAINNPTSASLEQPYDLYYRGQWNDFEGATQGSYKFGTNGGNNWFDIRAQEAVNTGKQFSFGIMPFFSGNGNISYDGARSAYPQYLHNLMQSAPLLADRDFISPSGDWMANWNSPHYLGRLRALHVALNNYILTKSYTATAGPKNGQTIPARDIIYCIDIRGFGNYGEWHTSDMYDFNSMPGNTRPTAATLMEIIDTHTEVFQDWPLVMMVAAYNTPRVNGVGGTFIPIFHPYNQVAHYALDARNNWGQVGYRRDQFGATDSYLHELLEFNTGQWPMGSGLTVAQKFLALFKTSPGTGEPYPGAGPVNQMSDLENQVVLYGSTSFGNGNWGGSMSATAQDRTRAAWKRSGYRIKIIDGDAPTLITKTVPFQINVNWQNVGVTPAYNNWQVVYELQTVLGAVVWTGISTRDLKLFRPDEGIVETTDNNLVVPSSVTTGVYKLVVRVKDPVGYRPNMKLAIQGINADGSYTIFSSVVVN